MAVERLPFKLAKPSQETFVTETSEIGHNGQPLDEVLEGLDNISKQSAQSEEETLIFETDGGVQVGKIDSNGADFANLKRGGQQVARMSDLPTKDTSIGNNPSNTNVPTSKAVKDYVDAHSGGDYPIDAESTSIDTEEQVWCNDADTQEYAKIGSYGMKSKAYLDMQGESIIDDEIGNSPSTTHAPSAKAVRDYVDEHGGGTGDLPISTEDTQEEESEQVWGNDTDTETYAKIGKYGIKAKGYYDLNGNPIGGNTEHYPVNKWKPILANLNRVATNLSTGKQYTDRKTITFLWCSDVHNSVASMSRFLEFKAKYNEYLDDAIFSGDVVQTVWRDDTTAMMALQGYDDVLFAIGNHDVTAYNEGEPYSVGPNAPLPEAYQRYMRNWTGVTRPANAATDGRMYYYKDYAVANIRLIVLDSNLKNSYNPTIKSDQDAWLETVLEDARTNGLSVICCQHVPRGIGDMTTVKNGFNALDDAKAQGYSQSGVEQDKVRAFINNGGNFICWMFGHVHADYCGRINTTDKQFYIAIGGALFSDAGGCESSKISGTDSEDLFNIVSIDTDAKLIRVIRVGNDFDRHCRHRGGMIIDYDKNSLNVISNW